MLERTRTILSLLEQADWFSAVGQAEPAPVIVLHSWEQAIEQCASAYWEDVELEASNMLSRVLVTHDYEGRYQLWNTIVDEVKTLAMPFIKRKIERVVNDNHLPAVFENFVIGDIAHIGLATEYSDMVLIEFHALQASWYVKGHFPCGWQGEFPNGKLIVY